MPFKIFLLTTLIVFSFALKDKDKETIYKAMSELKPALQKEACQFDYEYKDEEGDKNEEIYMKPCKEGYHCGQKIKDISHCIPNVIHQKYGEKCNYDNECIVGSCDQEKKICTFDENDKAICVEYVYEEMCRCGNDLIYSNKNEKCVDKSELDYVEGYCLYTKNDDKAKEVYIQPNQPFYVCGEEGIADDKTPELKEGTKYIKMSKIGSLRSGTQTYHELACEFGAASKSEDGKSWICDKIVKFKGTGINEDEKPYIDYEFSIAGEKTIVDDYEDYIYLNKLNGTYAPYTEKYNDAFANFKSAIKNYESKCKSKSHDYYFKPYDCGIKEINDAFFYLYNFEFYINKTEGAKTVMNAIKQEDFDKVSYGSSNILSFNIMILILISLLSLF